MQEVTTISESDRQDPESAAAPKARNRSAVALAYDASSSRAPRVVARGYGELAERIVESARDHGVFVHDSPELVGLLMNLDLDDVIPQELYMVVAELLVWVAELERERGSMRSHAPL